MKKFYIYITIFVIVILVALFIFLTKFNITLIPFTKKVPVQYISIPVVRDDLDSMTEIGYEDIDYKNIRIDEYKTEYIKSSEDIIGKYTNKNVCLKKGDYFTSKDIVNKEELPGNWIEQLDYQNGELGYYMSVKANDIFDNNILEDSYIDIYALFEKDGKKNIAKILENVKVLAIHDSSGQRVYTCNRVGTPSKIGFGVSQEDYKLLHKIEYLDMEFKVLPVNSKISSNQDNIISKQDLKNIVDNTDITRF